MRNYVTVATFQYPQEAYVIKSKLESEGIEAFLRDELTVQAYNFMSHAVGGVKLQIQEKDVEKALPILQRAGLLEQNTSKPEGLFDWLDKPLKNIHFLQKFPMEIRVVLVAAVTLLLITAVIFFLYYISEDARQLREKQKLNTEYQNKLQNENLIFSDFLYKKDAGRVKLYLSEFKAKYPSSDGLYFITGFMN